MAAANTALASDPVKQFSVFIQNRVGRLYDLANLLAAHNVHVIAMATVDTTDSAIVRLIVDDPDRAREQMVINDFAFTECDVLAVEFPDESRLKALLGALLAVEVNIHYVYAFILRPGGQPALALNLEDADLAAQALNGAGFRVLTQRDISR